jgi:hypothetical protein
MMFYRVCLLMPLLMPLPLVLGVDRTSISQGALEFIELQEGILRLGGIPYALLAALLFYRSFRWTSREMRRKLVISPVWMIPFQYVCTIGWLAANHRFSRTSFDDVLAVFIGGLVAVVIATLIVGYVYVLLGACLEWIQERHGVIGPHDTVR